MIYHVISQFKRKKAPQPYGHGARKKIYLLFYQQKKATSDVCLVMVVAMSTITLVAMKNPVQMLPVFL